MRIRIKSGEKEFTVGIIHSQDPRYKFAIGEDIFTIEKVNEGTSSLIFSLNGTNYQVYASENTNDMGFVSFEDHIFEMQREDFLPESLSPARFEPSGSHSNEVYSPMPGKVIKLFVIEGDKNKQRGCGADHRSHENGKCYRFSGRWYCEQDQCNPE